MASTPAARNRTQKPPTTLAGGSSQPPQPPVPLVGSAALPPIPASYICTLIALLLGVLALQMQGATLIEAVAATDAIAGVLVFLAWRQSK